MRISRGLTILSLLSSVLLMTGCVTAQPTDTAQDQAGNSVQSSSATASGWSAKTDNMMKHINALASSKGIGVRTAGSKQELAAATYIQQQFSNIGLDSQIQPFEAIFRGQDRAQRSQNVVATLAGTSSEIFVIGAHYDSVPSSTGTMGVIDNAASVALMIELAAYLKVAPQRRINFIFVAFGAEEVGLIGSKQYVETLSVEEKQRIIGMLNLDSIVGGDKLYIHSALTKGYSCDGDNSRFVANPEWRDRLLRHAQAQNLPFNMHPGNDQFPPGETAGWSDHSPFACAGIPIAYIEATNFEIDGEGGKDGYSQTVNQGLWDCFDVQQLTSCDRPNEQKWGMIWHTEFDRLEQLNAHMPGRIEYQLDATYQLLTSYLVELNSQSN